MNRSSWRIFKRYYLTILFTVIYGGIIYVIIYNTPANNQLIGWLGFMTYQLF